MVNENETINSSFKNHQTFMAPFALLAATNSKSRKYACNLCQEFRDLLEEGSEECADYFKLNELTEQEILNYRKLSKYYEEKMIARQIFPLNWLETIEPAKYPSKGSLNFEEFKSFYFENKSFDEVSLQERKNIAINDLLDETPLEQINDESFEQKLRYCIASNNKFPALSNYVEMMKSLYTIIKDDGIVYLIGAYVFMRKFSGPMSFRDNINNRKSAQ
jgi:hypothetical protein